VRREQRVLSQRQRRDGPRSSYIGSETFIAIVDAGRAPYSSDLRQLGLTVWCTNRDLPLSMPLGNGKTDFILDAGAPVLAVRCVAGPSQPQPSFAEGSAAWRLLNHLSLNYLSLLDTDPVQGAVALREMLALYCHPADAYGQRQVEGVRSISSRPVTRRMPSPGPITFGRGIEISVTLDDAAFEGSGAFLLGAVLAEFFAEYVSINSFTETVVRTPTRGAIMRWPAKGGTCAIL
jgi:type VI secretion system protein ImpG